MTSIPPIDSGTLADHSLRRGTTTHKFRDAHPGVNQAAMDVIQGLGSADWEEAHGN